MPKPSMATAVAQAKKLERERRDARLLQMMKELGKMAGSLKAERDNHPAQYALNRAWDQLRQARELI